MFGPLTRFGAISAARRVVPRPASPRLAAAVGGGVVLAIGVRGILAADVGVAPMDVFLVGASEQTGLGIGIVAVVVQLSLLCIATCLGRPPRTATWIFTLSSGATLELTEGWFDSAGGLAGSVAAWAVGFVLVVTAIAILVVGTDAGGSFELLSQAAADRGLPPVPVRTGLEISFVVVGVALGGPIGPGTAAFAVAVGPAVEVACRTLGAVASPEPRQRTVAGGVPHSADAPPPPGPPRDRAARRGVHVGRRRR